MGKPPEQAENYGNAPTTLDAAVTAVTPQATTGTPESVTETPNDDKKKEG
jgi:hypothetical protein